MYYWKRTYNGYGDASGYDGKLGKINKIPYFGSKNCYLDDFMHCKVDDYNIKSNRTTIRLSNNAPFNIKISAYNLTKNKSEVFTISKDSSSWSIANNTLSLSNEDKCKLVFDPPPTGFL